ncbi:MAG: zinc ribbon domain-containing protein, partial [Planctomycetota bacterium]|nr:zinc ribbon domain-containing protein [Planctomycetota bacterium]
MPIYEYHCRSCGQEFEQLVRSMKTDAEALCPQCGSKEVERKLSVFAAQSGGRSPCDSPSPTSCAGCSDPHGSCPMR